MVIPYQKLSPEALHGLIEEDGAPIEFLCRHDAPGPRPRRPPGRGTRARTGFTEKQGQYLAFIDSYVTMHGRAPAEADLERFFRTTPPSVHQMILTLAAKGLISRVPGQPRSIRLLIAPDEIPPLRRPGMG